jgi:rhodanese-related sulfurtransferase
LDARPEIFYRLGHVPGALSLARDDFENAYAQLKERLEKDKNQPLIIYCSNSSCEDSHLVQSALLKLGYVNVAVFSGGWATWTQEKLPEETNP